MPCLLILLKAFSGVKCGYVATLIVMTEGFAFWKIDMKCAHHASRYFLKIMALIAKLEIGQICKKGKARFETL